MTSKYAKPQPGANAARDLPAIAAARYAAAEADGRRAAGGRVIELPASRRVDPDAADQMADAVRSLVGAGVGRGMTGPLRVSRVGLSGDAVRDVVSSARAMDPYAPGSPHSRVEDMLAVARCRNVNVDPEDAAERLALAAQARQLRHQIRAWVSPTELGPLASPTHAGRIASVETIATPAAWLNSEFVSTTLVPLGPGIIVPSVWDHIATAFLDPAAGQSVEVTAADRPTLDGERVGWRTAALAFDVSVQLEDWTPGGGREVERALAIAVDARLEGALLDDLQEGAPTATTLAEAEAEVGSAWASGADVIVCNGADRPDIIRQYASANIGVDDRPAIIGSVGQPAGHAVMMASAGTLVEVSGLEWMLAQAPHVIGFDVGCIRYGMARPRIAGAVVSVDLTA